MPDFSNIAHSAFPPRCPKLVPEIKIHAVLAEGLYPVQITNDNFPFVLPYWHSQVVARYLLDNPYIVRGKKVVDLGTGCGLAAIAAARCGADAIALDPDLRCLQFTEINARGNDVTVDLHWGTHRNLPACDLLIAAGVFHDENAQPIAAIARKTQSLIAVSRVNLWDMDGFEEISVTDFERTSIHLFRSNIL